MFGELGGARTWHRTVHELKESAVKEHGSPSRHLSNEQGVETVIVKYYCFSVIFFALLRSQMTPVPRAYLDATWDTDASIMAKSACYRLQNVNRAALCSLKM